MAGHGLQGHNELDTTEATCAYRHKAFFAGGSSAPVRVESEGSTAVWLAGALAAPSVQAHGLSPPQVLWPYQSLFFFLSLL